MNQETSRQNPWLEALVPQYITLCLCALGGIFLIFIQRGFGQWSLLPVLAGLLGLGTRLGPIVLPLGVALCLCFPPAYGAVVGRARLLDIPDLIMCAGVLAYVVGHCRLQSVILYILPPDPRLDPNEASDRFTFPLLAPSPSLMYQPRSAKLVTRQEMGLLVISLPIWASLAQISWKGLPKNRGNPGLYPEVWNAVVLVWVLALVFLATTVYLSYWRRRDMTREEAEVHLQDVLWKETRREQRRLNRWLTWSRLRAWKKEKLS